MTFCMLLWHKARMVSEHQSLSWVWVRLGAGQL